MATNTNDYILQEDGTSKILLEGGTDALVTAFTTYIGTTVYDGITDFTSVALNLSSESKVTVAFWMWQDAYGTDNDAALGHGVAQNNFFYSQPRNDSGKFLVGMFHGAFWTDDFTRPSAAAWHHYIFEMNQTTPLNKVWVDGVAQTLTTHTHGAFTSGNFANGTLYLASVDGGVSFGQFNACRMSRFGLWGSAVTLSAGEIADLAAGKDPSVARSSGLLTEQLCGPTIFVTSDATLQLSAILPLGASAAVSDATLALSAQTQIPLGTSAATSTTSLALTAQTQIPLGTSAAVSTTSLALTAPTEVVLATCAATSTATLSLTAPALLALSSSAAQSATSLDLTAQTAISLDACTAVSTTSLTITITMLVLDPCAAVSTTSLDLTILPSDLGTAVVGSIDLQDMGWIQLPIGGAFSTATGPARALTGDGHIDATLVGVIGED